MFHLEHIKKQIILYVDFVYDVATNIMYKFTVTNWIGITNIRSFGFWNKLCRVCYEE